MDNKHLFIDGYLTRISEQFNVENNIAFEIFSIAAITERPFQEVYDDIQIRQKLDEVMEAIFNATNNIVVMLKTFAFFGLFITLISLNFSGTIDKFKCPQQH